MTTTVQKRDQQSAVDAFLIQFADIARAFNVNGAVINALVTADPSPPMVKAVNACIVVAVALNSAGKDLRTARDQLAALVPSDFGDDLGSVMILSDADEVAVGQSLNLRVHALTRNGESFGGQGNFITWSLIGDADVVNGGGAVVQPPDPKGLFAYNYEVVGVSPGVATIKVVFSSLDDSTHVGRRVSAEKQITVVP